MLLVGQSRIQPPKRTKIFRPQIFLILLYIFFSDTIFHGSLTTAYIPHYDYIRKSKSTDFNLDSAGVGGNRFATVLLYMTDLPEKAGGETGTF